MHEVIEVLLSIKTIYFTKQLESINSIILNSGLKAINLPGMYIDEYLRFSDQSNLYVSVDQPYGFNNTLARLSLVKSYLDQYGDKISGFNIGPVSNYLGEGDWQKVIDDLQVINELCKSANTRLRFFFNFHKISSDDDCIRIIDGAEQAGIKEIICGNSFQTPSLLPETLHSILKFRNNTSVQMGIFGNIPNIDDLNLVYSKGLDPIIVLPDNLLEIFS